MPVIDYIESKYEEFLNAESRVARRTIPDSRVHCCLYFVAPSGHGLKPLDVEFMQRLHDKVNIIPVIAKADTMTPDECAHFKKQVQSTQNSKRIINFGKKIFHIFKIIIDLLKKLIRFIKEVLKKVYMHTCFFYFVDNYILFLIHFCRY